MRGLLMALFAFDFPGHPSLSGTGRVHARLTVQTKTIAEK